jgi:hypothetical protein
MQRLELKTEKSGAEEERGRFERSKNKSRIKDGTSGAEKKTRNACAKQPPKT